MLSVENFAHVSRVVVNRRSLLRQAGFSLIELMIVLGIVGSALGLVLWYQGRAEQAQNVQSETSDVTVLLGKIRTIYGGTANGYANMTAQALNNAGLLGGSFRFNAASQTITDLWGQGVTVPAGTTSFALIFAGTNRMSNEACVDFVTRIGQGADEVMIGTGSTFSAQTQALTGGTVVKAVGGAIDINALITQCAVAARPIALRYTGG